MRGPDYGNKVLGMNKIWKCSRRKTACLTFFAAVIGTILILLCCGARLGVISSSGKIKAADVLLVDAGHGGFDGGAVSSDGVPEKDINLDIALEIRKLAEADGWTVVMTRETDRGLEGDMQGAIRSKKTADLTARKKLIDETDPALTISIHLNSFTQDRSVRGAQVFYPGGGKDSDADDPRTKSKAIAESIQKNLIEEMADGTNRSALSKNDVRLLKEVKSPIVIVECGFLSNHEEAKLLRQEDYQEKIAAAIYNGAMSELSKNSPKLDNLRLVESGEQTCK